jgi:hypothetical protein
VTSGKPQPASALFEIVPARDSVTAVTLDGQLIGFSRQLSDCGCVVVKLEVWDIPFYFAEHLREDNVMRFGVRGFDITDAGRRGD